MTNETSAGSSAPLIARKPTSQPLPDAQREAILASPGFGRYFTDHMAGVSWTTDLGWHDAEVVSSPAGDPAFALRGTVGARAEELGAASVHVSLSHDAGIASAVVILES